MKKIVLMVMVCLCIFFAGCGGNKDDTSKICDEYNIVVDDVISVYAWKDNQILPQLVDGNGDVVDARYDYIVSSGDMTISNDGYITVNNIPEKDVTVTIKERNTGATKDIVLRYISDLQKITAISYVDGTVVSSLENLEYSSQTVLLAVTDQNKVDISKFCNISCTDKNGKNIAAFDIEYYNNTIKLNATGLGEGTLNIEISNSKGEKLYQSSIPFSINLKETALQKCILESIGETLISKENIASVDKIYINNQVKSMQEVEYFLALDTIIIESDVVQIFTTDLTKYNYRVKSDLYIDYYKHSYWGNKQDKLIPYKDSINENYVAFHNDNGEILAIDMIVDDFVLSTLAHGGHIFSGWKNLNGKDIETTDVLAYTGGVLHLFATSGTDCVDEDKNHLCDWCGGQVGAHLDSANDGDHDCDYCGEKITDCVDLELNHICDECGVNVGIHNDSVNDHDHVCDYGCGDKLTDCVDFDRDHVCDECGAYGGRHADSVNDGDHICDYGCGVTLNACTDNDKDHDCDECGTWMGNHVDSANDGDHKCDYCKEKITYCNDSDKDHDCDECGTWMGNHVDSANDGDHKCDYCAEKLTNCNDVDKDHYCDECRQKNTNCIDSNKDHACDICKTNIGDHSDKSNDGDHECDYCNAKITNCSDADKNHACDECGTDMGTHADSTNDGDHKCDYCKEPVSNCNDGNRDHDCDECGAWIGTHEDSANDGDHKCDYCKEKITNCYDSNKDHACDECGANVGTHSDAANDGDHKCEYCNAEITKCSDADKNHACDECGANVGTHSDNANDGDHLCDYGCGKSATGCSDGDIDGYCDECQKCYADGVLAYKLNSSGTGYIVTGRGTSKSSTIIIPDTYKGLPVTEIEHSAFIRERSINTVIIGKNITAIGYAAFQECNNLKRVNFKNPDGWAAVLRDSDSTTYYIDSALLEDVSVAAQYLHWGTREGDGGYANCNWKRT